jgi:hypothetical protein
MGRKAGQTNIEQEKLYAIIKDVLPSSKESWRLVAGYYKEDSREAALRDGTDLKRYFCQVMCNKFVVVTGSSIKDKFTKKCQLIHKAIADNEGARLVGGYDSASSTTTSGSIDGLSDDDAHDEIPMTVTRPPIILPPSVVQDTYAEEPHVQVPHTASAIDQPLRSRKRVALEDIESSRGKSKSARNNSRMNAGKSIASLAETIAASSSNSLLIEMMKQQQQQQANQMMMQQQLSNQMMMMMMTLLNSNKGPVAPGVSYCAPTTASNLSSFFSPGENGLLYQPINISPPTDSSTTTI